MSIQTTIDQALLTIRGTPLRTAYKRTNVSSGGSSLLGIGVTNTTTDTVLYPQPAYTALNEKASVLSSSSRVLEATDLKFTVSGTAISVTELMANNLTLVLEGPSTVFEEFTIIGYTPIEYQGVNLAFTIFARSTQRN